MNSGNDNVHSENSESDNSKNLLKLQQLSELGLEFFDTDLDNETLALNLLNQDSSLMNGSSPSKEQIPVDFSNLNDYVSESIIATLSPKQQIEEIPIIKVLPVSKGVLIPSSNPSVKNVAQSKCQNIVFTTKASSNEASSSIERSKLTNGKNDTEKPFSNLALGTSYDKSDDSKKAKFKTVKMPNIKVRIVSKDEANDFFASEHQKTVNGNAKNNLFMNDLVDTSELDNKINDTLLDMLQDKIIGKNSNSMNSYRHSTKSQERSNDKDVSKFITIFPSKSTSKIINLMVKGRTCRSKQPLTEDELRIVTGILNQENMLQSREALYKNVFYDTESDTNIRYEVKRDVSSEENNPRSDVNLIKNKKGRPKSGPASEENDPDATKNNEKYVLKSISRTRCGRVSRPPRHVIRDYKRLKHLTAHNSDVEDENENTGGYADYQLVEDAHKAPVVNEKPKQPENLLYGPLEPSKRQFSSLSLCPTCGKVYLGYRRMAIHFQKYPDHRNEELLKRLSDTKKKSFDETALSDSSEINTNEEIIHTSVPVRGNGAVKRKRKLCRKIKVPAKSNATSLKELLCVCGVDEILKYAAPVVAGFLSSWEYLLIRSNKLKTKNETLAASLLKEVTSVLKQIRSLSQCLLKPYVENKENIANKFIIEEEDVLRHVLGIKPGAYVASGNESWTKEFFRYTTCFHSDKPDSENSANNSPATENESLVTEGVTPNTSHIRDTPDQSFYKIDNRLGFSSLDFSQNIRHDLSLNSNSSLNIVDMDTSASTSTSAYEKNSNKSIALFKNISNGNYDDTSTSLDQAISINSLIDQKRQLLNDESNSTDYNSSYCAANTLNFDSFVSNSVDMMNDFPISLPLLSDNSSDSKDCLHLLQTSSAEDLLNSLKTIDNGSESVMVGIGDSISSDLPLSTDHTGNLSSTFGETVNESTSPCILDFETISSNFHCND